MPPELAEARVEKLSKFDAHGKDLPRYWRMGHDVKGRVFFYHRKTQVRTYRHPAQERKKRVARSFEERDRIEREHAEALKRGGGRKQDKDLFERGKKEECVVM